MRVGIKQILANPEQKQALITRTIIAIQAREGVVTTEAQALAAYRKVQDEEETD